MFYKAVALWRRGIGARGPCPPGMTVKKRQRSKMKILMEQLRTSPLSSVEDQLRLTFKKCQASRVNTSIEQLQ